MGARSRSFPSAEPSHSSISRAVAPGCRAGRASAAPAPATPVWGRAPLRSAPLPSPWILAFTRRTTGPASERRNFPVSCGADADFWLIRLVMAGLASRYLFNHLLFGGRGIKS